MPLSRRRLAFAVVLFFTGRELSVGSAWARGLTGAALDGMALVGALGCLIMSGRSPPGGYSIYILATAVKLK